MIQLEVLAPANQSVSKVIESDCLDVFSAITRDFIEQFSQTLLQSPQSRPFPELVALGFWLRKSNIQKLVDSRQHIFAKPLGLVMHFTPANVDTMFIYSWVCSLLMGNKNIVRVASQKSALQDTLFSVLNALLQQPEFSELAASNVFVQYDKQSDISLQLSAVADARVIWGGDDSVNAIRQLPVKPRCRDISFADRYSAALVNGDALKNSEDIERLAERIWRDTEPYLQQACSSPRVIFWSGQTDKLNELLRAIGKCSEGTQQAIQQVNNHLVTSQLICSTQPQARQLMLGRVSAVEVSRIDPAMLNWHTGDGLFLIVPLCGVNDLIEHCDAKLQTLSYWGVTQEQVLKVLANPSITGIDRIVPVGQALDFAPVWDGYDLLGQLSRQIVIA